MNQGWSCPNCGKAHAPHVQTCPEVAVQGIYPGGFLAPFVPDPIYNPNTSATMAGYTGPKTQSWNEVRQ